MFLFFHYAFSSAGAKTVITATKASIGDKVLNLKKKVDEALTMLEETNSNPIKHVLCARGEDNDTVTTISERDVHLERVCNIHTEQLNSINIVYNNYNRACDHLPNTHNCNQ